MIATVMGRELSGFFKSRTIVAVCALVLALIVLAAGLGAARIAGERSVAERAQADSYQLWLDQGEKNPHSVAHFGLYAFRPAAPLGHVDAGITRFSGSAYCISSS